MGEGDDEYRVDQREIVINGNHRAYRLAEHLDQMSGKKYEIGDDVFVPALTIHITKNVCLAWAGFISGKRRTGRSSVAVTTHFR